MAVSLAPVNFGACELTGLEKTRFGASCKSTYGLDLRQKTG